MTLRALNPQVWVQAAGRLLCQVGYGLINFYIPILFVNQVGLSATSVGLSVGLSAVTEILGHFLGGAIADSRFGRKSALEISAVLGILVTLILIISDSLLTLTCASLLLGISLGFYWTASSAAVMDAATPAERPQAFALMGVMEYLGVGIGVLGGGLVLALVEETPQQVFGFCGLVFGLFAILIWRAMPAPPRAEPAAEPGVEPGVEPKQSAPEQSDQLSELGAKRGFWVALQDRALLLFVGANIFYATYVALVTSTIPLYFTNYVAGADELPGVSLGSTANLFTWCYVGLGAVVQLPLAQALGQFRRTRVLMGAILLWAAGFCLLWAAGSFASAQFAWAILGLCLLSVASVAYKPFSVAIVSDLAPESLRGSYMAVSSQAWTVGYFIGPILGGWAMDQSAAWAHLFWLGIAASAAGCIGLLWLFERLQPEFLPSHILNEQPKAEPLA